MIVIPIGHESDTVRRLPWVTFSLMAVCIIVHIFLSIQVSKAEKELMSTAEELVQFYIQHPYLTLDQEAKDILFGEEDRERVEAILSMYGQGAARSESSIQREEQEKLDQLSFRLKSLMLDIPYRKWGFIPAEQTFAALLTYMFVHGGWLHLLGNLLLLYLMGPFIEDLWGRGVFAAFYLGVGMVSALMYAQHYPNFSGPLIGASGAIAGIMGAFLIKYWKTRIRFFYWIGIIFRGTFEAPAYMMLPLWLGLEIFNAKVVDSLSAQGGGVAHWAHVWGFVLGVAVAVGMMVFRVEEKYIHPKIGAKIQTGDKALGNFIKAVQKKNMGRIDEAYSLLLEEAKRNPSPDVVETLWACALELGKVEEAAKFFIIAVENEIRRDQMESAFRHFSQLRQEVPQAVLRPTYAFALLKYLTDRQELEEAKKVAEQLLENIDENTSPLILQNFAEISSKIHPEVAKKVIPICLSHPEIPEAEKEKLKLFQ